MCIRLYFLKAYARRVRSCLLTQTNAAVIGSTTTKPPKIRLLKKADNDDVIFILVYVNFVGLEET